MELSEQESNALVQFRDQLDGFVAMAQDHFLIRWLRARNLDVKKARDMLLDYMEWMNNNKNMPILKDWTPAKAVVDDFRYKIIGEDFDGRPVIWLPVGRFEIKQLLHQGLKDDLFRHAYKIMDELVAAVDAAREKSMAEQFVGFMDLAELAVRKASIDAMHAVLRFFRELDAYYPELIHAVYVINAPYIFGPMFSLIKPIMSNTTISKVQIYNSNQNNWQPVLFKNFPREIIPLEYGGSGPPVLS